MSKHLWIFVFALSSIFLSWRGGIAGYKYWQYVYHTKAIPIEVDKWEIIPKGWSFLLRVHYSYSIGNERFNKKETLPTFFLNKASAEYEIGKNAPKKWQGWISPNRPSSCILIKKFPLKEIFYGICAFIVFLYFCGLKLYLDAFSKS